MFGGSVDALRFLVLSQHPLLPRRISCHRHGFIIFRKLSPSFAQNSPISCKLIDSPSWQKTATSSATMAKGVSESIKRLENGFASCL